MTLLFASATAPLAAAPATDAASPRRAEGPPASRIDTAAPRIKPISEISLDIRPGPGRLPEDTSARLVEGPDVPGNTQRDWAPTLFCWRASNLAYQPLVFEDVPLERYGQHHGHLLQPAVSGGRFFLDSVIFPVYLLHHKRCETPLGYYRPGECAPPMSQKLLH